VEQLDPVIGHEAMVKVAAVTKLHEKSQDRAYWLSRPMAERIAAVEILRQQLWGQVHIEQGLQRVCRVTQLHELSNAPGCQSK
jgi:hypothetical protein